MNKPKVLVHGRVRLSPFQECAPVCTACGTGMVCGEKPREHFCGWYKCSEYNAAEMNRIRAARGSDVRLPYPV